MRIRALAGAIALASAISGAAVGQSVSTDEQRQIRNSGTIGLLAARADSAFTRLSDDLGIALDDGANLRVLTILGKGSLENIQDLLFLRGVDVAITQSDTLEFFERLNLFPNVKGQVTYIAKLANEEFHLLTKSEINSIDDLEGKKVNFGRSGTGTFLTSAVVFDALGITVEASEHPHRKAYELLKAGEIDAMAKVDGKPVDVIANASVDDSVHLISLPVERLAEIYSPARIDYQDYPSLFATEDDFVETVAVSGVMAAYNWPDDHERRAKLDKFVAAMFANLDRLQDPANGFDSKWSEIDPRAEVPGWTRDPSVVRALEGSTQAAKTN